MDTILADHFDKLLEGICTPQVVRAVETTRTIHPLWSEILASGFLDALRSEADGGAGLMLAEVAPLMRLLGARAFPLPVAETMVARSLLAAAGYEPPPGPIALATTGSHSAPLVPFAAVAPHILLDTGTALHLYERDTLDIRDPELRGSLAMRIYGPGSAAPIVEIDRAVELSSLCAVVRAAQIAGAAGRILELTLAYARERIQFGKPIGRQQAIQQQLALMAEHAIMADMAAQIGCSGGLAPSIEIAAVAKQVAGAAAFEIANTAHAVHCAIGISEEFDLQLLTRRLHEWRFVDGSDDWWGRRLGKQHLASRASSSIHYVRDILRQPADVTAS